MIKVELSTECNNQHEHIRISATRSNTSVHKCLQRGIHVRYGTKIHLASNKVSCFTANNTVLDGTQFCIIQRAR